MNYKNTAFQSKEKFFSFVLYIKGHIKSCVSESRKLKTDIKYKFDNGKYHYSPYVYFSFIYLFKEYLFGKSNNGFALWSQMLSLVDIAFLQRIESMDTPNL